MPPPQLRRHDDPTEASQKTQPRSDSKLPEWLSFKVVLVALVGLLGLAFLLSGITGQKEVKPGSEIPANYWQSTPATLPSPSQTASSTPYVYVPVPAPREAATTPQSESDTATYANQLALLDRSGSSGAGRIERLLRTVAQRTGDSEAHIADRTARSTLVLKQDYGKEVTNERFLGEQQPTLPITDQRQDTTISQRCSSSGSVAKPCFGNDLSIVFEFVENFR